MTKKQRRGSQENSSYKYKIRLYKKYVNMYVCVCVYMCVWCVRVYPCVYVVYFLERTYFRMRFWNTDEINLQEISLSEW